MHPIESHGIFQGTVDYLLALGCFSYKATASRRKAEIAKNWAFRGRAPIGGV